MKLSTLFSVYREAVARRDIAVSDLMLFREAVNVEWRYRRIVRLCAKLEKAVMRRLNDIEERQAKTAANSPYNGVQWSDFPAAVQDGESND